MIHIQFEDLSGLEGFVIKSDVCFSTSFKQKLVDPKNQADAIARSDASAWNDAGIKEVQGLVNRGGFEIVDRPACQSLPTTMVCKHINFNGPSPPKENPASAHTARAPALPLPSGGGGANTYTSKTTMLRSGKCRLGVRGICSVGLLTISNKRPTVLRSILVKIGCSAHLQPLLLVGQYIKPI